MCVVVLDGGDILGCGVVLSGGDILGGRDVLGGGDVFVGVEWQRQWWQQRRKYFNI